MKSRGIFRRDRMAVCCRSLKYPLTFFFPGSMPLVPPTSPFAIRVFRFFLSEPKIVSCPAFSSGVMTAISESILRLTADAGVAGLPALLEASQAVRHKEIASQGVQMAGLNCPWGKRIDFCSCIVKGLSGQLYACMVVFSFFFRRQLCC